MAQLLLLLLLAAAAVHMRGLRHGRASVPHLEHVPPRRRAVQPHGEAHAPRDDRDLARGHIQQPELGAQPQCACGVSSKVSAARRNKRIGE
jgi:hypothetical protein